MMLIREFELKISEMFAYSKLAGTMFHLSIGQEATSVGIVAALEEGDYMTSHHRGHGHMIALGADVRLMMAEMFGRKTGYCKGKGGSMHIADIELGNLGANGIVGAGIPIATGAAYAIKYRGTKQVVLCPFGDGAINEGVFHESLNFAALHKLPIVYVIENNQYAMSTSVERSSSIKELYKRACAYGIPGEAVDGMDVEEVLRVTKAAVERARNGNGPTLIESKTYRYYGHSRTDSAPYRTKEEEEMWKQKDPIKQYQRKLIERGVLTTEDIKTMQERIQKILDEAVRFADSSPYPDSQEIFEDIYA
jgi:pyruvate dehydrogenase E1 component alpha subunit